ncbi:MAG: thioredoxin domain-containing protein [Bacteroidota bacterium]
MKAVNKTPNRLMRETSPYLLQHAHNPVDWYPWGDEAFAEARRRGVPVMLSSGYSACHWCHVMERESFADAETARLLNENFVSVKVDREERPDIDQLYQAAVQAIAGQGGWPLTVFLTPEGEPIWGGTYFPPEPAFGRPSFKQVLASLAKTWREQPADLRRAARELTQAVAGEVGGRTQAEAVKAPVEEAVAEAVQSLVRRVDRIHGGFGYAPKFPNVSALLLMLRHGRLRKQSEPVDLALLTLRRMAMGGIHDQLGGGFHRYATDERWLVPHFEKMLYDNAQLLTAYSAAWQITKDEYFAEVARGIIAYIGREMTSPAGGFYATQDADSEGVEGKFFVWRFAEVKDLLTEGQFAVARLAYGLTESGNFEGANILTKAMEVPAVASRLNRSPWEVGTDLAAAKETLVASREKRVKPFRDEKIILGWNGLMISGLAYASQALDDPPALAMAQKAADFALRAMQAGPSHLYRIYMDGRAKIPAFLDDYAFLIGGLIDLYESDFDPRWLVTALRLQETVTAEFRADGGRYTLNSNRGERLVAPPYSGFDQAIPSGVAVHCQNLIRLRGLTGNEEFAKEADQILTGYAREMANYPSGYAALLTALEMRRAGPLVAAIVGLDERGAELLRRFRQTFVPYRVVAATRAAGESLAGHPAAPLLVDRPALNEETTFYVCTGFTCHPPRTDWAGIEALLQ